MPHLIERIDSAIVVDAYQFMLVDIDGANGQPEGALDLSELTTRANKTDWFVTTANLAIITSSDTWHLADIAMELWDGQPPDDDGEWVKSETTILYSSSGRMRLSETLGGPSKLDTVMDLRDRTRTWPVRASFRPGPGVRYIEEQPREGIESYRLQFWPSVR
ncbi:hypothetical protein GCM10009525_58230 [Streptosporangium amethystogenes subsp. fukuiense]